jgi:hypothetical protein
VTSPRLRALPTCPVNNDWTATHAWHASSTNCAQAASPDVELDLPRLIGGLAAVYHGSPFTTEDADITPEATHANLIRLAAALSELNAGVRTESVSEGQPFACDAEGLAASRTWNLVTDAGDVDVSFQPSGTRGYPDLHRDATSAEIYDATVQIASLSDIIRSKQAANRPKDQRVLPALREILANHKD